MIHNEYNWKSHDGLNLFGQSWKTDHEFIASILLIHGIGEHSTRYDHWAERFVKSGYNVISFDLRGHGKSEGKKGHIPGFESLMQDIDILMDESDKLFPNSEKIIYGHSLGGNLALNYCLRRKPKLKAVIATSPWIGLVVNPSNFEQALAKAVKNIFPALVQKTKLQTNFISKDHFEVEKYEKDPLVHDKISVMFFLSMMEAAGWLRNHTGDFKIPLLLMHGSGDQITSHKATENFYQKARDVATLKIWDGLYHELHHEKERELVFQFITDWLKNIK